MTEGANPGWAPLARTILQALAGSWFAKVVLGCVGLILAFVGVDRLGVPTRHLDGTISDERNTWSMKRRHRCRVYIDTPAGELTDRYTGQCRGEWKRGGAVTLDMVAGRLTGNTVVGGSLRHTAEP